MAYSRDTNANQRRVLDAMAGEVVLSDEQFVIGAYRATQYKNTMINFARPMTNWCPPATSA